MCQQKTFYLIWNPNKKAPTKKHSNIREARAEAKRLAELNKGQEFIILKAVESVEYSTSPFKYKSFSAKGINTQEPLKAGDLVKITKAEAGGYFNPGDLAILKYQGSAGDWWADFTINPRYTGDGEWCLQPDAGTEFQKVEFPE